MVSKNKKARGKEGVLASIHPDGDVIRLNLDDAEANKTEIPKQWRVITPYTSSEYDKERLLNMELTDKEYAEIGLSLVARLVSAWKAYE